MIGETANSFETLSSREGHIMSDANNANSVAPESVPVVQVTHASFACDGGGGALGHPKVQLTLDKSGKVDCPYCGLHFELAPGASADAGH